MTAPEPLNAERLAEIRTGPLRNSPEVRDLLSEVRRLRGVVERVEALADIYLTVDASHKQARAAFGHALRAALSDPTERGQT